MSIETTENEQRNNRTQTKSTKPTEKKSYCE